MFTVIDKKTGRVLRAQHTDEVKKGEIAIKELVTEPFKEAFFNHTTKTFYGEKWTDEEIKQMIGG